MTIRELRSMGIKIIAIVIIIVEAFLSHQSGRTSGKESRWLSEKTGVNESFIRSAAHVLLFAVLAGIAWLAFGTAGIIVAAVWAIADEATKPLLHNQRHCSLKDILLNLAGTALGTALALLIQKP